MDYHDWVIHRGTFWGLSPDDMIAPRYDGKANALFADGHVAAIAPDQVGPGAWPPDPGG